VEGDYLQQQLFIDISTNQLDPVAGDLFGVFFHILTSIWEALSMASHPPPKLMEFDLPPPLPLQLI